jgi:hypothetical protein
VDRLAADGLGVPALFWSPRPEAADRLKRWLASAPVAELLA